MPIPIYQQETEPKREPVQLRLVYQGTGAANAPKAHLYPRTLAHCVDLFVVQGFSLYVAKLSSLALITGHMSEIQSSGKLANGIFADALHYGNSQVFLASLVLLSFVYFIGMPLACGRTLGLGVFGLKLEDEGGARPGFTALAARYGTLLASFASLGLVFAVGLRRRDGRFLHDQWSGTRVTRA